MFCDLVESTALSERLDPEELRDLIRAYQQACAEVIQKFEGHIAQYLGDGLLVYFGYPRAHEDDAQRAVHAGLGIVERVRRLTGTAPGTATPSVRVGVHTGLVVVGDIGAGTRHEQLALGDTPNLAARLQALADPNTMVISRATERLVQGMFVLRDLGRQTLKGIAAPVAAFQVLRESGAQSRLDIAGVAGLTPLVGRDQEIALLLDRWERASEGNGHVVLLTGEPGIGKSRLVRVVEDRIAGVPHRRLECRCSPYYQHTPLYPVIDLLPRAFQWERDDAPETKLGKLERGLAQYRVPQAEVVPLLVALLSLPLSERYPLPPLSPERQKQKTLEAVLVVLLAMAAARPLLLIVEDLHWVDPTTLEFLTLLLNQVPTARVLVLLTARPAFIPPWTPRSHLTQLTLTRFTPSQTAAMVTGVTGGKRLPTEVAQQIVTKTDGVPLFVEELTKMVLEAGLLREEGDHWELAGSLPPLAIPTTLQDSLMARLDRLATVKEVAQLGATLGRGFTYELLRAVAALDDATLEHALGRLVEAELLYQRGTPPDAAYTFKHALVQDAAYESLLKRARVDLHTRIAGVLQTQFPKTAEREPELVAHHYTAANLPDRAIPYWLKAGRKALARVALPEAVAHLNTGLRLVAALSQTTERDRLELDLRDALATANFAMLGWASEDVLDAIRAVTEIARRLGDFPRFFSFLYYNAIVYSNRCDFRAASPIVEELVDPELLQRSGDLALVATSFASAYHTWTGQYQTADRYADSTIERYRVELHKTLVDMFNHDPKCFALSWKGLRLWMCGYPDQARAVAFEQIDLARQLKHPFNLIWSLTGGAGPLMHRGEAKPYGECVDEARAMAREQAMWFLDRCIGSFWNGLGLIVAKQYAEGYEEVRNGNQVWRDSGGLLISPLGQLMMALALGHLGQARQALGLIDDTIALVDRTGHVMHEPEAHRVKGELLLLGDAPDHRGAEDSFHRAITLARGQHAKGWELRAATSLSRLWQEQGRSAAAYDLLAPIHGWFSEGFDTADLTEAKALLDELA
jgi:class 3 adenylate cyclase